MKNQSPESLINSLRTYNHDELDESCIEAALKIGNGVLWLHPHDSLNRELVTNIGYFPKFNPIFEEYYDFKNPRSEAEKEAIKVWYTEPKPDIEEGYDYEKLLDTLNNEAIERIKADPTLIVFAYPDKQAIQEITDYNFITLFETFLLIGWRIECDPKTLIGSCVEIFLDAMLTKKVDPREPSSLIPCSKLHKTPKMINGEFILSKGNHGTPDFSWKLTVKEAAEFAVKMGYPEIEFKDLLADQTTGQSRQEQPKEPLSVEIEVPDKAANTTRVKNTKTIRNEERKNLYMIIAAYNEIAKEDMNRKGLCTEIMKKTERLGEPVSLQTISRHLKAIHDLIS
jgi:hypothetical protein